MKPNRWILGLVVALFLVSGIQLLAQCYECHYSPNHFGFCGFGSFMTECREVVIDPQSGRTDCQFGGNYCGGFEPADPNLTSRQPAAVPDRDYYSQDATGRTSIPPDTYSY